MKLEECAKRPKNIACPFVQLIPEWEVVTWMVASVAIWCLKQYEHQMAALASPWLDMCQTPQQTTEINTSHYRANWRGNGCGNATRPSWQSHSRRSRRRGWQKRWSGTPLDYSRPFFKKYPSEPKFNEIVSFRRQPHMPHAAFCRIF